MKSKFLEIKILSFPLKKQIATNIKSFEKINAISLRLTEHSDFFGESFIHALGEMPCHDIVKHIKEIHLFASIQNAFKSLEAWKKFWFENQPNKKSRFKAYAFAALDIAVWDLFAKINQKPLHQMLSKQTKETVPVYGTTGWLSLSEKELIVECEKYAKLNIDGYKIRLGDQNDYIRVNAVRKAMGERYTLMLDATQQYETSKAIEISKRMENLNITWLEEPIVSTIENSKQMRRMKQASTIPIAAGENILNADDFEEACKNKICDILQPDIIRCAGITGFLEIAETIQKYSIPLCNHLLPELSISLIAAFPNCYFLEYDDLLPDNIFTEDFSIHDGHMRVPTSFGTGVSLNKLAIKTFEVTQ